MGVIKIMNIIWKELELWFECIFVRSTPGIIGTTLRRLYWSRQFKQSSSFTISHGCVITNPKNIYIGRSANIMHHCCLYAHNNGLIKVADRVNINSNVQLGAADNGEIIIGSDVAIGPNTVIRASNHNYKVKEIPINKQGHTGGKIVIEDDVWIGANVVILPDVVIGRGAVVGAGAVVNKSIPAYSLAGGVPARVIKENCRV